jgi:hypothetical protein
MSATLANLPTFSGADWQDNDTYGEDCTDEMANRQTTISSVGTPLVSRTDNKSIGPNDLVISNISILAAGLKFGWKGSGGVRGIGYIVKFPLQLASGDLINRSVVIPIPQFVG